MNIEWALERLNEGHAVKRKPWSREKFVKMRPTPRNHEPRIMQSWNSQRDDIVGDDWELAEESVPNPCFGVT